MYKLDLEKVEEPEIKLDPEILWLKEKARELKKKKSTSASLTTQKLLTVWIKNKLWNGLKDMGISDYLTYLLRNLYAGQEATVRTGHGKTDWSQTGKEYIKAVYCSPCLFNLYAVYIMRNTGLDDSQAGI